MAEPFKKQIVRYSTPHGRRCSPDTPGAVRTVELSHKWYGTVNGKPVPLCRDKGAAQKLLNKLLPDAALRPHGLTDHLDDFRAALVAKGDHPRHVKLTVANVRAVLDGIGAVWLAGLDAGKAVEWLAALRADRQAVQLPVGQELFRLAEVAKLLGVKPGSVTKAIRRHKLQAVEAGPARRYPRATVEALAERTGRGASPETVNHYVRSLRAFGRWLARSRRWPSNPFETLDLLSTTTDRRRDRRELDASELRRLLKVTRESERPFRGLSGEDRFHLYATACGTGFRASALASLTPESFDLGGNTPTVTLAARHAKNRKTKVQPLPPDVADLLRAYLREKPAGQAIWGGTWAKGYCGAEMLRGDLDAAGIPYAVEGPDGPLSADFRALRHSYLTLAGRAGIDLPTLQELAGHSTPTLTARYSHRRLHDLAGAVEKLPNFLPTEKGTQETQSFRATGTDGANVEKARGKGRLGCSVVARTPSNQGHSQASSGTEEGGEGASPETTQPLVSQGFCHRLASPGIVSHQAGELGFEPRQADPESAVLPLHHSPKVACL